MTYITWLKIFLSSTETFLLHRVYIFYYTEGPLFSLQGQSAQGRLDTLMYRHFTLLFHNNTKGKSIHPLVLSILY